VKLARDCKQPAAPETFLTTLINEIILPNLETLLTATRTAHLHKSGRWQDTLSKRALSGKRCFAIYNVATRTIQKHVVLPVGTEQFKECRGTTANRIRIGPHYCGVGIRVVYPISGPGKATMKQVVRNIFIMNCIQVMKKLIFYIN